MEEDEGNLKISDYKNEDEGNMVEDNQESVTSDGNERVMSVDESATLNLNLLDKRLQKVIIVMNVGVFGIKSQHSYGFRTI